MKSIANKLKLKLQNVPLKEFNDENDWNDFVYWLRNNWVKWGQGDIIGSSWNKKHKFVYIDFR